MLHMLIRLSKLKLIEQALPYRQEIRMFQQHRLFKWSCWAHSKAIPQTKAYLWGISEIVAHLNCKRVSAKDISWQSAHCRSIQAAFMDKVRNCIIAGSVIVGNFVWDSRTQCSLIYRPFSNNHCYANWNLCLQPFLKMVLPFPCHWRYRFVCYLQILVMLISKPAVGLKDSLLYIYIATN